MIVYVPENGLSVYVNGIARFSGDKNINCLRIIKIYKNKFSIFKFGGG